MVEFINKEELVESIPMPKGARVSVFCNDKELLSKIGKKYRTSEDWCEDTLFALIYSDENAILNMYNATQRKINYILFGPSCTFSVLNKVLWRGTKPFCPTLAKPNAICLQSSEEDFFSALAFLCVRRLESAIRRVLNGEKIDEQELFSSFYKATVFDEQEIISSIIKECENCADEVDGLVQSLNALILLCRKEEKNLKREESVVLLARFLIKVYNVFVDLLPQTVIPTDYGKREEILADFFSTTLSYEEIPCEYEIRKNYFLLEKYREKLKLLCKNALCAIEFIIDKYESFRSDKGFCYGCDSEDYKLSIFASPSILVGNTLLQTIVRSGVGDEFL